jgi:hypothetical protein
MSTTVWLALICLILLGGFLLRSNIGARPMDRETAPVLDPSPDFPIDDRPPLAKSDRLPSPYFDGPAAKPAGTVQILPPLPDPAVAPKANQTGNLPSQSTADTSELTTWHWHVGSKITKRTTVAPRDSRKAD